MFNRWIGCFRFVIRSCNNYLIKWWSPSGISFQKYWRFPFFHCDAGMFCCLTFLWLHHLVMNTGVSAVWQWTCHQFLPSGCAPALTVNQGASRWGFSSHSLWREGGAEGAAEEPVAWASHSLPGLQPLCSSALTPPPAAGFWFYAAENRRLWRRLVSLFKPLKNPFACKQLHQFVGFVSGQQNNLIGSYLSFLLFWVTVHIEKS